MPHVHDDHSPRARSPWAMIVIGIVLIVFGIFWSIERTNTPTQEIIPVTRSDRQSAPQVPSIDTIETELEQITIPEYSKVF